MNLFLGLRRGSFSTRCVFAAPPLLAQPGSGIWRFPFFPTYFWAKPFCLNHDLPDFGMIRIAGAFPVSFILPIRESRKSWFRQPKLWQRKI
jgi:hypothetical protein